MPTFRARSFVSRVPSAVAAAAYMDAFDIYSTIASGHLPVVASAAAQAIVPLLMGTPRRLF